MKRVTQLDTQALRTGAPGREIAFSFDPAAENRVVNLYPDMRFQTFLGFGGAFTESAAYNYARLSAEKKREVMTALFDETRGLGYRFCRTHIGSCDFSLSEYAYVREGDASLESFDLGNDRKYILPMLRDALCVAGEGLFLFSSPWSPPGWMKTNGDVRFGGQIKPEYMDTWARYVARYILAMRAEGVPVRAITVQNEPIARQTWESCEYSARDEKNMIRDHLCPVLDANELDDVKIIIWDHNKERVYDRARDVLADARVRARVWGIGFHWYSGAHFDGVALAARAFPEMQLIETEFCTGLQKGDGANGFLYAEEILGNLNAGMTASTDWNLLLDAQGGPYHYREGGCDAVILADAQTGALDYRAAYLQTAHFSRFIKPGAVRVGATGFSKDLRVTSFQNTNGVYACVVINGADAPCEFLVRMGDETAPVRAEAKSIQTLLIE